jgi:hypothetical protein
MKYWNRQHRVRERCWFRVAYKRGIPTMPAVMMKRWLQNQASSGKFYIKYPLAPEFSSMGHGYYVYFERAEDATWFALMS